MRFVKIKLDIFTISCAIAFSPLLLQSIFPLCIGLESAFEVGLSILDA